jgi:hypothetical protein
MLMCLPPNALATDTLEACVCTCDSLNLTPCPAAKCRFCRKLSVEIALARGATSITRHEATKTETDPPPVKRDSSDLYQVVRMRSTSITGHKARRPRAHLPADRTLRPVSSCAQTSRIPAVPPEQSTRACGQLAAERAGSRCSLSSTVGRQVATIDGPDPHGPCSVRDGLAYSSSRRHHSDSQ